METENKLHQNLKAYLAKKKNRITGFVMHQIDSNKNKIEAKKLIKSELNRLFKDFQDLIEAFNPNILFNIYSEEVKKEFQKKEFK